MSYTKKTQSRIWATSIVYKQLLLSQALPYIKQRINNPNELSQFFNDYSIFEHGKGDLSYFIQLYNSVSLNMDRLINMITQVVDIRSLSCLPKACSLCALAELHYNQIEKPIVIAEYAKLLDVYAEDKTILYKLFDA